MDPQIIILVRWNPRILIYHFSFAADGPTVDYIISQGPQEFIGIFPRQLMDRPIIILVRWNPRIFI